MATKPPVSADEILLAVNQAVKGEPAQNLWLNTPLASIYNFRPSDLLTTQAGRDKLAAMLREVGLMA